MTGLSGILRDRPVIRRIVVAIAVSYLVLRWGTLLPDQGGAHAIDARTYWGAPMDDPYPGPQVGLPGAYLYSPAFIQALAPLRLLPWEAFHAVWVGLGMLSLVYLVGPIGGALAITVLPFVQRDLFIGNIHLILAAAMVIGLRHPAAWSFVALTKVTPGIGVAWFAFRRDWRGLGVAVGTTLAIAAVSFAIAPDLWFEWIDRLRGDSGTAGGSYMLFLVARVAGALGIVWIAARSGRRWLVPVAATLAVPIIWPDSLAMLLAAFPLIRARASPSPSQHARRTDGPRVAEAGPSHATAGGARAREDDTASR